MIDKELLGRLRRAMERATPGEWAAAGPPGKRYVHSGSGLTGSAICVDFRDDNDADFVADAQNALPALLEALDVAEAPIPMILFCPMCRGRHIDEGTFATKSHHTHACQHCGMTWRPAIVPTIGVQFMPGFKNEAPPLAATVYVPCGTVESGAAVGTPRFDGALSLAEIQLLHQGLAVLGDESRVDLKLVDVWRALIKRIGDAGAALAALDATEKP